MNSKLYSFIAIVALVCALGACAKKKDKFAGIDGDYDYVSGTPLSDRNEGASFFGGNVNRAMYQPVYFAFDSYQVDGSEMGKVQQVANAVGGKQIIVAGFTDERGTAEYNRGLGERRALAVRDALIQYGVNAANIQTVSFGADMPADPGSGEAAWARNRRAEFGIVD